MIDAKHAPEPAGAPPHPFRTAPWYDPGEQHRPCQCPRCQAARAPRRRGSRWGRTVLVVLGGAVLPAVSVAVNHSLPVVQLGALGILWIAAAALSTLLHLGLSPMRPAPGRLALEHAPPSSTALRVVLLGGAVTSTLLWGYLAMLFLPLFPLSVIALVFAGIGLCGLCPYGALAVALIHTVRDTRAVAERLGRRAAVALLLCGLLLPVLGAAATGGYRAVQRRQLGLLLTKADLLPPYSAERMRALAALAGQEERLVETYAGTTDPARHRLLAEAYLRLTEESLSGAVRQRVDRRHRTVIRPFWFLVGEDPVDLQRLGRL